MITIGAVFHGPELEESRIKKLVQSTGIAVNKERGPWIGEDDFGPTDIRPESGQYFEQGSAPAVNVIFYVPGSLGSEGPTKIEAGRFSRKKKLLLVAVPVPKEVAEAGGSVKFVIGALREAITIAAKVFADKNAGTFDLVKAEAIIDGVQKTLTGQLE
jgi:hypothetical protein